MSGEPERGTGGTFRKWLVSAREQLKWPERHSRVVRPFWMARYPVTIDQFGAFVDDSYGDRRWHLPGFPPDLLHQSPPKHQGRHGNYPLSRGGSLGFRVVCSSPITNR